MFCSIAMCAVAATIAGAGTPLLEARNVTKSFGSVQALAEVDFAVHAGEVMALVGDNGAGKSTLIKCIAGIYPIDSGDVYDFLSDAIEEWDGDDVDELFELLEAHLAEVGVELKYKSPEADDEEEPEAEEEFEAEKEDDDDDDALSEDEPLDLPDSDTE